MSDEEIKKLFIETWFNGFALGVCLGIFTVVMLWA